MEVKKVLVSAFLLTTCLMSGQAQRRNEIQVPDLDGYTTLKCDFHMHSVFSDGLVWPTVRVDEAYRDGLDAISLTEHIEYRPHKQDVVSDHNRSFDLCREQAEKLGILLIKGSEITRAMAPGHFNAIFLSDSNPLEQKDYKDAFREAKSRALLCFGTIPDGIVNNRIRPSGGQNIQHSIKKAVCTVSKWQTVICICLKPFSGVWIKTLR